MATTIAISGKGGSGKTTLAAMIIRLLCKQGAGPVLAVDADPNSCLGLMVGVSPQISVAQLREQAREKPASQGMDKVRSFEYGIQQAVTEADKFDLLTMGRPEGPECYCAVNNLLRQFLDKLSTTYSFVVIDNEAGMEHLSRRTTNNIDLLCIVAESTPLGTITAKRIYDLAKQLPISVKKIGIIWNRSDAINNLEGIETFGLIPYDKTVLDASMQSKTVFDLNEDKPALSAVRKILENILNQNNLSLTHNSKLKT
ncbi:MAG: AAA family ATPase [Planctomycetota bacterium]|nr:MAG: AAA family ATPase [Planctomycetota bacterium]